jgi:hypothetical protein
MKTKHRMKTKPTPPPMRRVSKALGGPERPAIVTLAARLPKGTVVIDPSTGETSRVKWASIDHVQFEGGTSCSPANFDLFYRECDIVRPGETKQWFSGDDRTKMVTA